MGNSHDAWHYIAANMIENLRISGPTTAFRRLKYKLPLLVTALGLQLLK